MRGISGRWLLLLVASLALNLFVLGAVAGARLGGRTWVPFVREARRPTRLVGMPNPRHLRSALDARHRPVLDAALAAHGPAIRERIRALAEARAGVAEAIRTEPFDRAVLEAALGRLRAREADVALATQGMVVDVVSGLDTDGRARVADLVPVRRRPR